MITKKTYFVKLRELKNDYEAAVESLNRKFAISNSSYRNGDVISDHFGSIIIEDIQYIIPICEDIPKAVYYGICLGRNNEPNGKKRMVLHQDIEHKKCRRKGINNLIPVLQYKRTKKKKLKKNKKK